MSEPEPEPEREPEPEVDAKTPASLEELGARADRAEAAQTGMPDALDLEDLPEPKWGPNTWDLLTRFHRVHHTLHVRLDRALENEGLSFAQVEVMAELGDRPNLHAGAIARRLGIRRQSAHALLGKLHSSGLVEVLPRNEGVRIARLTGIGKTVIGRCGDALQPAFGVLGRLPAAERRAFLKTLDDIEAALRPPRRNPWFDL